MNKFKEWAESINSICTTPVPSIDDIVSARKAADYLDSLDTLADGAPNDCEQVCDVHNGSHIYRTVVVTKESRDYYQAKCTVLSEELTTVQQQSAKLEYLSSEYVESREAILKLSHAIGNPALDISNKSLAMALVDYVIERFTDKPEPDDELVEVKNTIALLEQVANQERAKAEEWVARFDKLLALCGE